jgi:hypothetical protein
VSDIFLWRSFNSLFTVTYSQQIKQLRLLYGQFVKRKYGSYGKARQAWQNYKADFMADEWDTVINPALTRATLLDVNGMPTETPVEFRRSGGKATVKLPANTMYLLLSAGEPKP